MATAILKSGKPLLTGIFDDGETAERAYRVCVDHGYEIGDVNAILSEETRKKFMSEGGETRRELAQRKSEGGELGGPAGGRVGILVTVFAAVGAAIALPGIGFAAGPIAVALTAAGAAGVAAGLIGALEDWGIPADRIRRYEASIRKGGILLMVATRTPADASDIERLWWKLGGRDIHCR